MKKYAFAVEIEPNEIFEVFDVITVPDDFPNIQRVWSEGISAGVPAVVQVSGVSGVSTGDSYIDGVFTNKKETNSLVLSDDIVGFALVSNSTVYGHVSMEATSFNAEKYIAATQEKTIVFDATDVPQVVIGSLWDGDRIITG